ncbi:hypothetical protein ACEPAH_3149 [Sanghuangporus vaninii]
MAQLYLPYRRALGHLAIPEENGFRQIPEWLQDRLRNQVDRNQRASAPLEYSLYGVINGLLSIQFPLDMKFIVKPQAALRATDDGRQRLPVAGAFFQAPQQPNTSGGSSSNQIPILADFVVAKAHESLNHDIVICIVEVKRDEVMTEDAKHQMGKYLIRAASERWKIRNLYGFLICRNQWTAFRMDTTQNLPTPDIHEVTTEDPVYEPGHTDDAGLKRALCRISRACWGYPTVDPQTGIATFQV